MSRGRHLYLVSPSLMKVLTIFFRFGDLLFLHQVEIRFEQSKLVFPGPWAVGCKELVKYFSLSREWNIDVIDGLPECLFSR